MINLDSFPVEVIKYIFQFLPPNDLLKAGLVCKRFYKISQIDDFQLSIPKLNTKIIQENALGLWNYPEDNYNVGMKGKLIRVAPYHLYARLSNWIFAIFFNSSTYEKTQKNINRAVEITFKEIYRLNKQDNIDNSRKQKPLPLKEPLLTEESSEKKEIIARRIYVWNPAWGYSAYHPANYLADKILNSTQFAKQPEIEKAAQLVKGQADLYENLQNKYILFENVSDKKIFWRDLKAQEAFFDHTSKNLNY